MNANNPVGYVWVISGLRVASHYKPTNNLSHSQSHKEQKLESYDSLLRYADRGVRR